MQYIGVADDALAQLRRTGARAVSDEEHARLWAEARRLTRARTSTRSAAPAPSPRFEGPLAELRAARQGRELGQRFQGDPYRAARALGIRVERVPELRDDTRPTVLTLGRYWRLAAPLIQLAAQSPPEERRTLAHEIGHHAGIDEALCDIYARAFLAEQPPTPAQERHRAQAEWAALLGRRA